MVLWPRETLARIETVDVNPDTGLLLHEPGDPFEAHQTRPTGHAEFEYRHAGMAQDFSQGGALQNTPYVGTVTAPDGITENLAERLSDPGV